jgi:hypothetical protein
MSKCKLRPIATKEQTHDLRTEADMFLPFWTFNVWTRKIPEIMQEECCPKAWIPGKAPSDPPSNRNEEGVYEEAVRPEEGALGSDSHRSLKPPS